MMHLQTTSRVQPAPHRFAERVAVGIGVTLILAAAAATQAWLDRHFLPSFFMPRSWYVAIENTVRLAIAVIGAMIVTARRPVARLVLRAPRLLASVVAAAILALVASEVVLRTIHLQPTEWLQPEEEPRRQPDAQLGWVLAPGRTGHAQVGGHPIEYAVDAAGYRVRSVDQPVDPARPALVFVGESVMFGEGLTWDESIPAQTGAMLGIQTANLAVHGYSNDQMYLRLARELPRFRDPVAVVGIFMTELFGRNLDDDRPHLGPGLVWRPAAQHSRLVSLAGLLVPYRRDRSVERAMRVTHDALRASVDLARAHGATPLIVVPQFGPEDTASGALRRGVLADDIPSVFVMLDQSWRLPWDRHPNARAAQVIAAAVAARLRQR